MGSGALTLGQCFGASHPLPTRGAKDSESRLRGALFFCASRSDALQRYALSATNAVGQKTYRRSLFSDAETTQVNCSRYRSADDAQRAFLAAGGPAKDPQDLDPDGDGYACAWNPAAYR